MNHYDPVHDLSPTLSSPKPDPTQQRLFADFEAPHVDHTEHARGTNGDRQGAKKKRKATAAPTAVKNFVLDTNVLLHDPQSIGRFAEHHVWIPVDVLSELDRFKNEQSERGANAREVHRALTKAFSAGGGDITSGVETPGGGTIRIAVQDVSAKGNETAGLKRLRSLFPDFTRVDHRILGSMQLLADGAEGAPVVLVTKDLNLQLKAMACGLRCEDYLNDKVEAKEVEGYDLRDVEVSPHELQRFAATGELSLEAGRCGGLSQNEYVLFRTGDKKTIPARYRKDGYFQHLKIPESLHIPRGATIKPVNLGQQCLLDALLDPELSLVTCFGVAGTGKTLLAVAAGLSSVFGRTYHGLTVSRPVVPMGDTLGFLPGTLEEKMRPWLQPIYDALDLLMPPPGMGQDPNQPQASRRKMGRKGGRSDAEPPQEKQHAQHSGPARKPYDHLIEQGIVEIEALCYIRGRSIPRRYFVLDEAQQLTPLEAKTLVTRMSRGSKLVMVGDPGQIDNPYVDSRSNGLVYTRTRLRGQACTAHISLTKGERSLLAELGAKLM